VYFYNFARDPQQRNMYGQHLFVDIHPTKKLLGCEIYLSSLCYVGNKLQDPFTPKPASYFRRFWCRKWDISHPMCKVRFDLCLASSVLFFLQ